MMLAEASAPAKVILCGEHAVVYGQPAIAVPVSGLRVVARVEVNPPGERGLRVVAGDMNRVLPLISELSAVRDALELTAGLVLARLQHQPPDLTISIESDIPIASGLGSGAAVSAAFARALSAALGNPLNNAALNEIVYEVEKIHHGTPSGIDNTVIVYEQPVYFVRQRPIEQFDIKQPFTLLIGDTGQSASTKIAVGDVCALYEAEPERIQPVIEAIGMLVQQARRVIEAGDIEQLGRLMTRNHGHLRVLTVSSPELDALVQAALDAGALGAKLSGGGRGGNMIALVTAETKTAVRTALLSAGAKQVFETTVS